MNDMTQEKLLASKTPLLVAFSGGKDSVAMVLHLLELGVDKERIHLHHHDVDGDGEQLFDWACTKSYCQKFADHFGLKIFFSYRKGGIAREIYRTGEPKQDVLFQSEVGGAYRIAPSDKTAINTRRKFPAVSASLMTRWCSATVKIEVLRTAIAHNSNYLGEIFILTGERRQESRNRAQYEEWELHATNAKKRKAISCRLIIDWTEHDVWAIMERWKVQPHPAYMLGYPRCSCQLCIFNSPNIWNITNHISPKKVLRIAEIETDIQHTLYNKSTIFEKIASAKDTVELSEYWVGQGTGIFTAPIIVDIWTLPIGAFKGESAGSL